MPALEVRVAEYITTRELTPAEPPSPPTPQLVLPAGYLLPQHYLTTTNFYTHVLRYSGPWPTNEFTVCFWAHRLGRWEQRSVLPYANRLILDGTFRKIGTTAVSRAELSVEDFDILPVDITSSDWHFFALVRSGAETYLSVDLQPFLTVFGATGYATPWAEEVFTGGFLFVDSWTPGFTLTPRVAYYRSWDTVLGLTELRREARARSAVKTANLYRDTPLEASLSDVSGNGRDWVIQTAGTVVPSYGHGPLPWFAEGVTVTDEAAAVLVSPGNLPRVELVGARDVVYRDCALVKQFTEAMTVTDGVAAAPPDPLANATVRWYFFWTSPSFSPSGAQGGWTYTPPVPGVYSLRPRAQLGGGGVGSPSEGPMTGDVAAGAGSTHCATLVTEALPAQIISGDLNVCFLVYDAASGTTRRTRFRIYGYVTVGASDSVRGVFLNYSAPSSTGNLWPAGSSSSRRFWQFEADVLLSPVAVQAGDRVVFELGFVHDAGYPSSFSGIIYQLTGHVDLIDAEPNDPGDFITNPTFNPAYGEIFANNWVAFSTGLLTNALGCFVTEAVTVAEGATARILTLAVRVADTITVQEEAILELSTGLYVRVGDAVGIGESASNVPNLGVAKYEWRFPFDVVTARLRYRPQTYGETITVTDDVSVAATTPTNITRISVYDDVAVIESAGQDPEVTPPDAEGGGGEPEPTGDGIYVYETITVDEYRLRELPTSVLEIRAYEYITVLELEQMASFPVVWDGSGSPPAPATIADDYWLVGI